MGVYMYAYMYALSRSTKTVPVAGINLNFKQIAESKCHGKPSHGLWHDEYSPRTLAAIEKNHDYFCNHKPDGFVFGKMYDGANVFAYETAAVYDSVPYVKIGTIAKSGRSFKFVTI